MRQPANCPRCGSVFIKTDFDPICKLCQEAEQHDIEKVTEYIRERRYATIDEIHIETQVRHETLLKMCRRGTLIEYGCVISYPCSSCGVMITQGISCSKCIQEITDNAQKIIQSPKEENRGPRMYSKDYIDQTKNPR